MAFFKIVFLGIGVVFMAMLLRFHYEERKRYEDNYRSAGRRRPLKLGENE